MVRSKYSLITKLEDIPMDDLVDIASSTWDYLKKKLGTKRRKQPLSLELFGGETEDEYCGAYFPHSVKILVYLKHNKYLRDFIQTIIHEYTHYLQPIIKRYATLMKKFGGDYDRHPFEVEARNNEYSYYRDCWKTVKRELNYIKVI